MAITAVIPVRAGSTRVKNKNIRPFAGSSLLEIKIKQLQQVKTINQVLVSSDSKEMLDLAKSMGAIPMERPYEYCDEKTRSFNDVVRYIASEQVNTEHMMWAPCVCPFVDSVLFEQAVSTYDKIVAGEIDGDSVVSAELIKEYIFDENKPVNFSIEHHVPSQMLPNWHCIKNGFFIAKTQDMYRWGFVYGPNPVLFEITKKQSIDIDDEFDFLIAETVYKSEM